MGRVLFGFQRGGVDPVAPDPRPQRIRRALRTGPEQLRASIDRLAELARTQPQA